MSTITENKIEFTRINNDVNGNPRYVCHFYALLNEKDLSTPLGGGVVENRYKIAVKKANKIGGKKFHNKQYGGGIVFQSYSLPDLEKAINEAKNG
jgi:hypothetical protein